MEKTLIKPEKLGILFLGIFIALAFFPRPLLGSESVFCNALGMQFVLIPAGTFTMGSPPDEPNRDTREIQHTVRISKPFYLQTTEVTLDQWWALMGKKLFGRRKGPGSMPVVKVSWHDCMDFIKKLNALSTWSYRLPTEAEWEYACRSGTSTAYNWGNTIDCGNAMYGNNSFKSGECIEYVQSRGLFIDRPAPVKSYHANAWGLYDMHGNVWEWCHDWYGDYTISPKVNPRGPDSGTMKVRRGGSWFKYGYSCRSANRNSGHPSSRFQTTGFRLIAQKPVDQSFNEGGP